MRSILCTIVLLILGFKNLSAQTITPANPSFCTGSSVTLTASNPPVPTGNYQWEKSPDGVAGWSNIGGNSATLVVTSPGFYRVSVSGPPAFTFPVVEVIEYPNPVAAFNSSPSSQCATVPVNFTNTSTGAVSYAWNFGDPNSGGNNTSTAVNPTHRFIGVPGNTTQTFTVTLTATSSAGCVNTTTRTVTVNQLPDTKLGGPGPVIYNGQKYFKICNSSTSASFSFTNQSTTNNNFYQIIWGDGSPDYSSSTFTLTSHTYSIGTTMLRFIVTGQNGCKDTADYFIFLGSNPAVGLGNPGNTSICTNNTLTFPISGTSSNPPGTIYTVTFNDGSAPDIFNHPAPPSITHNFLNSSCGTNSPPYSNSFSATIQAVNPCLSSSATVVPIYVSQKPSASFIITPKDTVCVGLQVTATNTSGVVMGNDNGTCTPGKAVWKITPSSGWTLTGGSLGNDFGLTDPSLWTAGSNAISLSFSATGNYSIKLITGNPICGLDSVTKIICVNPAPIAAFNIDQSIGCAPLTVNTVNLSNSPICGNNIYQWSVTYASTLGCVPTVSLYSYLNGTSATSFQPVFQFDNPGIYTIQLITKSSGGVCISPAVTKTVTVKGKPVVTVSNMPTTLCQGTPINPSGSSTCYVSSPPATYAWSFPGGTPANSTSASPGPIYYSAPGNYVVTLAVTNECGTTTVTSPLTVYAVPVANAGADVSSCHNTAVQIGSSAIAGVTYQWGPFTSGLSTTASSNPTVTLSNSTSSPITNTYIVTATLLSTGCTTKDTVVVTVLPIASVTNPGNQTVCNNSSTTAVNFTGSSVAGTIYNWTNNNPSIGLAASGTGNIASFTAINSGSTAVTATITVTPSVTNGIATCAGPSQTFTITVTPTPTVNQPSDQTVCNGFPTTSVVFGGTGTSYTWTNSNTAIGLAATGNGNIPVFTAANATSNPISATITVTPKIGACTGPTTSFMITVNPAPIVNVSPSAQTVCSGQPSAAVTLTSATSGATITWTSVTPAGITGNTTSGTGNIPVQTLTNSTSAPINVTYSATATSGGGACAGPVATHIITVNPIPVVNQPVDRTFCNNSPSGAIIFSSSTSGTTYSWTNDNASIGLAVSGLGNIPSFTAVNNTASPVSATITVTPTYSAGAVSCTGTPKTFIITVNPTPVAVQPANAVYCKGVNVPSTALSGTPASGVNYTWTNNNPSIGLAASGTGDIPSFVATNTGSTVQVATINITPTYSNNSISCAGAVKTFTITVNPTPSVSQPADVFICNGAAGPSINFTGSAVAGTTYAWTNSNPAIGLSASGSGNISSFTGINTGTAPISAVVTVTPTFTNSGVSCDGPPKTFNIIINPTPSVSAPSDQIVCRGTQTALISFGGSAVANTIYTWTNSNPSIGLPASGTGNINPFTAGNNGTAPIVATITVTPNFTNGTQTCQGTPKTFTITVNPSPSVQFSSIAQTICSNTSTTAVTLTSTTAGAGISWTANVPGGITGAVLSGTTTIPVQQLINTTNAPLTVVYTAMATTGGSATCSGVPADYNITVNPVPVATASPASQTICSNTATSIALSSPVSNTTFTWTATSSGSVTGMSPGNGNNIVQTLINNSSTPQTVTYTITPAFSNNVSCPGSTISVVITVNPSPTISNTPLTQTICSGGTTQVVNLSSTVVGTTYTWAATGTPGITGFTPSGTGDIPAETLTNNGSANGTVTYVIIPKANGCDGLPVNYVVTVRPVAQVTNNPMSQTICSGTQSSLVTLTSNVAGASFAWTATATTGITGYTVSGTNTIPVQTISNANPSPGTITYAITPSINGCAGTLANYVITVNPSPQVIFSAPDQTICSGNTTTAVTLTSPTSGAAITWTSTAVPGISGQVLSGSTVIPAQTLTNSTNGPLTITYTASANTGGSTACGGGNAVYSIIVYPSAVVQFSPAPQTICSGNNTSAVILSSPTPNVSISWTASIPAGITGALASGTTSIPQQQLVNNSNLPLTIVYTAVATTSGTASCPGGNSTYSITVNPVPTATATPSAQTICSGTLTSIALSSPVTGTTFSWTVTSTAGITGVSAGSGNTIAQIPVNSTTTVQTVTYIITPSFSNVIPCAGNSITVVISVNPVAVVTNTPLNQAICSGGTTQAVTLTSSVPATTYTWTASATAGTTGFTANGTGDLPAETLTNSSSSDGIVTYVITPSANSCAGLPVNYIVTVRPVALLTNNPLAQTICSGSQTSGVTLTSNVTGATFAWTANATPGISGFTPAGSNIIPVQTLTNSSTSLGTVTYTITPSVNGCNGIPADYVITVNPSPQVIFSAPDQTICSGNTTAVVNLTSPTTGASISWTSNPVAGISGQNLNGTNTIPAQTLINTTNAPLIVTYNAVANTGGSVACPGIGSVYHITVNPSPQLTFSTPVQTICSGTSTTVVNINSPTPGITINWTAAVPPGISGAITTGNTGQIPVQTLTNSTNTPLTVVYTAIGTTSGTASCAGNAFTYNITVNPSPDITAIPNPQTICSGTSTNIALTSSVSGTTFTWSVTNTSPITGATAGSGNNISQVLTNNSSVPQSLLYVVTPNILNSGTGCNGSPVNVQVTVNPLASINNSPLNQSLCTGSASMPVTWTSLTPGASYTWTGNSTTGVTGFTSSGTGDLPAMTLVNTGLSQASVVYSVTAISNQCAATATNYTIRVNPNAKASFTVTDTIKCPPFIINSPNITVQPYPANTVSYQWYANGIFIGTGLNFPGYTIQNENDSVKIKLVAVSLYNCNNDSMSATLYTYKLPHPTFTKTNALGCGPLTVTFTNTTNDLNLFSYLWDFGNGQTSTAQQPAAVTYQSAPTFNDTFYIVKLKVFSICDTVITSDTVFVKSKPKALFTPNNVNGCSPMHVSFTNTSLGIGNSYYWDFDDGQTFTTTSTAIFEHIFNTGVIDTFHVKLLVINSCGSDSLTYLIITAPNSIYLNFSFNGTAQYGCAPHPVAFYNNSSGAGSFVWNFGDGNSVTTTNNIDTVTHTYNLPGVYTVSVTAYNNCSDTTASNTITVYAKPIPAFTANTYNTCIGQQVQFTNGSTGANALQWQFGDGTFSSVSNPLHAYAVSGVYDVKLIVYNTNPSGNVCSDSLIQQVTVTATQQGNITVTPTSSPCAPLTVSFTNLNVPATSMIWDYGDGQTGTGNSTTHTYNVAGVYTVTAVSTSPLGCVYNSTATVTVGGPAGTLQYNAGYVCYPNAAFFQATATNAATYFWQFGDGNTQTTTSPSVSHQYANPGTYTPSVTLQNGAGCNILLPGTAPIKVDKVKAGFTSSQISNCGNTVVAFNDTSHAYFGTSLIRWDFGDSQTGTGSNPTHTYYTSGTYTIQIIAIGISGCSDTAYVPLTVTVKSKPSAVIAAPAVNCGLENVTFIATITSGDPIVTRDWLISNGATGTGVSFTYSFSLPGTYTVRFIAGTSNGCFDTAYHTITIKPVPIVIASGPVELCLGNTANLSVTGATTYQWNPTQGLSCNTCPNPVASPVITTPYVVAGTTNGCTAYDTVIVTVIPPINMQASGDQNICIGQNALLQASGAATYIWTPAATLSADNIPNPVATPTSTTTYRVIGYDGHNCFSDTAFITVGVGLYPVVSLGPDVTLAAGTQFPLASTIQNGPIQQWQWTPITDLSCSSCPLPIASIKKDISYAVTVTTNFGCSASDTIKIKVFCADSQVYIPNAFSPDGDGINDVIFINGKGVVNIMHFRIFNRWGEIVFEKTNVKPNNPSYGWDGRIKGKLSPPDVFVYTAEVMCENGSTYTYKGNISIIK